jgi:hypothetical protein
MVFTQPLTGTSWKEGGYSTVDNRFYDRGPLACVAFRDNRGEHTNISPYIAGTPPVLNWSPFAVDGQLRDDLFADVLVDGEWFINTDPNEGWWRVGAFDEKSGPDRKGSIKHDDQMILQSNFPYDTDLVAEGKTIQFTPIETRKPSTMRLRFNLPVSDADGNSIVEDVGAPGYVLSKPVDADTVDRQFLCIFARKRPQGYLYTVEVYPLVKMTDLGSQKRSKTDPDAAPLTFTALPDAFHTDIDPSDPTGMNLIESFYSEFIGGDAWTAMYEHGS